MKIPEISRVREADAYTIQHEPIASVDLMERAASRCCEWMLEKLKPGEPVQVFCGPGNNGGDGLVLARLLAGAGFPVKGVLVWFSENASADFSANLERLGKLTQVKVTEVRSPAEIPAIEKGCIVVDALFGSGLSKPVQGLAAEVIGRINDSAAVVVAIDMPSGMFSDQVTDPRQGAVVRADYTLTFQFPKLGFLFAENEQYVGEWTVLPIGLHPEFIDHLEVENYFLTKPDLAPLLKPRSRFAHKGNFGHALLISGSYGKMGAAVLAAKACLRSGAGLVTVHVPKLGYPIIQTAVPEAMVSLDESETHFSGFIDLSPYNAVGIGPGIGKDPETANALKLLIQNTSVPLVLDADALNILGENKTWLAFLPPGSILTPHPKEFERLAGKSSDAFERNRIQHEFAKKYKVNLVLKGAYTALACPDGSCWFNSTGNPGMATGGSGDVLTGIILGLMAQGYGSRDACLLGVYLHGLAGDLAAEKKGLEALIAGDIAKSLGKAFKSLYT